MRGSTLFDRMLTWASFGGSFSCDKKGNISYSMKLTANVNSRHAWQQLVSHVTKELMINLNNVPLVSFLKCS